MNILFITYHDFSSNSAIQIHNFANTLIKLGNNCCIAVPTNKKSVNTCIGGEIYYKPLDYSDLVHSDLFPDGKGPDIIHAWTPREIVRKQCISSLRRFKCKLIIHLEDNEELILENTLSVPINELMKKSPAKLNKSIPDSISHPIFYKEFLNLADGITLIIDKLIDFVPKEKKFLVVWPGLDQSRFYSRNIDDNSKRKLGIDKNDLVLCYTGNVHFSNAREVRSLYLAVALLNREGIPTKLIRTGKDFTNFLGDNDEWARKYSIELGFLPHQKIPEVLNLADILVQPGKPDRFNEYRLPSKLPEFFAMAKPVILPNVNLGRFIKEHEEGLLLEKGDALDIVEKIKLIIADENLRETLSRGGHQFALNRFDLDVNTKSLEKFYRSVLDSKNTEENGSVSILL